MKNVTFSCNKIVEKVLSKIQATDPGLSQKPKHEQQQAIHEKLKRMTSNHELLQQRKQEISKI